MALLFDLKARRVEPEIMDQPDLPHDRHASALRGLERINAWSASARALWPPLARLMRETGRPLRVLDVATGGGDVPVRLLQKARNAKLPLRVDGCDMSPVAVEYASARARRLGADIRFFVLNALEEPLPRDYYVIMCTLFLHHLREEQAVDLLRRMGEAARRTVLVDDLQRRPAGMGIAYLGTRFLSRSKVVHIDGLRSVAAAFTMEEASALAASAGLSGHTIQSHWPFRYLLCWRRE